QTASPDSEPPCYAGLPVSFTLMPMVVSPAFTPPSSACATIPTVGWSLRIPPSDDQADHGPACATVCQMCQSASSVPRAKTSSRPSELSITAGSLVMTPPRELHVDHG